MPELSLEEIRILIFLTRKRRREEARRPPHIKDGLDVQYLKVHQLDDLVEKLEEMELNQ